MKRIWSAAAEINYWIPVLQIIQPLIIQYNWYELQFLFHINRCTSCYYILTRPALNTPLSVPLQFQARRPRHGDASTFNYVDACFKLLVVVQCVCHREKKKKFHHKWKSPVESNPWRPPPKSCLKKHAVLCVKRLNMPLRVGKKKRSLRDSAEAIVSVLKTSASLSVSSWMSASSLWCNSDSSHLKKPRHCEHTDGVDTWSEEPNVETSLLLNMSALKSESHLSVMLKPV